MNLFHEAKKVLDKDGKVNALGPYGKSKLTGMEVQAYFKKNPVKDNKVKKAVEVALDLGGAHSVASKEIAKFYGSKMLKHPDVKKALMYANESIEEVSEKEDTLPDIEDSKHLKNANLDGRYKTFKEKLKALGYVKEAWEISEINTKMPEKVRIQILDLYNKAMDLPYGSPAFKKVKAEIDKINKKYSVKEETITEAPAMPSVQSGDIDLDSTDHTIDAGVINYVTAINNQLKTGQFAKLHKEKQTEFKAKKAKRFWRIEQWEMGRASSIHAFIEVETGDIYKPAGWKAAAKGARGNVTDNRYIKFVAGYPSAYHGGHLYK
tara:strand:+ start:4715 stop:5677 length:963 start_codon:yes stop_codon:yes gene_type:complete